MGAIHRFRSYLLEEEFELHVKNGQVHSLNFTKIGHFDANKVLLYYEEGMVSIEGTRLVVSKLMQDEILITGSIKKIEFR